MGVGVGGIARVVLLIEPITWRFMGSYKWSDKSPNMGL